VASVKRRMRAAPRRHAVGRACPTRSKAGTGQTYMVMMKKLAARTARHPLRVAVDLRPTRKTPKNPELEWKKELLKMNGKALAFGVPRTTGRAM